jgi:hypothetical protein
LNVFHLKKKFLGYCRQEKKILNKKKMFKSNAFDSSAASSFVLKKHFIFRTQEKQQEFKALLDNGDLYFRFRCICRNLPAIKNTRINIPLIKVN